MWMPPRGQGNSRCRNDVRSGAVICPAFWCGSLANVLTPTSWRRIKATYIEAAGGRCRICGEIAPKDPVRKVRGNKTIEAHEIWSYHDARDGGPGIQRLDDILALCGSCHMMFHLG